MRNKIERHSGIVSGFLSLQHLWGYFNQKTSVTSPWGRIRDALDAYMFIFDATIAHFVPMIFIGAIATSHLQTSTATGTTDTAYSVGNIEM